MSNVSLTNHIIHFILGIISNYYSYIIPLFLVYQIIDGYKFNYKVKLTGNYTDDIQMDLLSFSVGMIIPRLLINLPKI